MAMRMRNCLFVLLLGVIVGCEPDEGMFRFSVSGKITDQSGDAPSTNSLQVKLNPDVGFAAKVGADGSFEFHKLLAGEYQIVVTDGSGLYEDKSTETFTVAKGVNNSKVITLSRMTLGISGKVTDASTNEPLNGVSIKQSGSLVATTNSGGSYSMSYYPGTYTFLFEKDGYQSVSKSVTVSSSNVTLNVSLTNNTPPPCSNPVASGTTGPLRWFLCTDGILTITGKGDMPDYTYSNNHYNVPWYDYQSSIVSVVIDQGVTSIGEGTFQSSTQLTSVSLPEGITKIGERAFGWSELSAITIPKTVLEIGAYAFATTNITSLKIPASVKLISGSLAYQCRELSSIEVSSENKYYTSVNGVLYDKSVTTLMECPNAKSGDLVIPNTVSTIADRAFDGGNSFLKSVSIPASVKNIGYWAFANCWNISSFVVNTSNPMYSSANGVLYDKNKTVLMYYPQKKTDTECVVPNTVKKINEIAVVNDNITKITVPASVEEIGWSGISGQKIRTVYALGKTPPKVSQYSIIIDFSLSTLYVPSGSKAAYQSADVWKNFKTISETLPTSGLVAYYPFNGNASDASGNGNNGQLIGGTKPTYDRKGNTNNAYNFGGINNSSAIKIPNSATLKFTGGMSFSLWYRLISYAGINGYGASAASGVHCLISKDGDRDGGLSLLLNDAGNNKEAYGGGIAGESFEWKWLPNKAPYQHAALKGQWVHVAVVCSNTTDELYINGVCVSKGSGSAHSFTKVNTKDLYIGRFGFGTWYPFNGDIDDVRIYNRALTADEVKALFNE
jgi:hypothetical protein